MLRTLILACFLFQAHTAVAQRATLPSDQEFDTWNKETPELKREYNPVCGNDVVTNGRFDLKVVGPLLAGEWTETAAGMGMTLGMKVVKLQLEYDRLRNHLYLVSRDIRLHLKPRTEVNPIMLRRDYTKDTQLEEKYWAVKAWPEDVAMVVNCNINRAPQFTWEAGSGKQRASGVISFFSPTIGMGMKWNTAGGAREQFLQR